MCAHVLGLDLGPASIGWALIEKPEREGDPGHIVAMGSRVFPEGVDRDTKGLEKSKNAQRREARGARRVKQRRKQRRRDLVKTLRGVGLLPADDSDLRALLSTDPYPLRAKGLDKRLEPFGLGRVLYHLNQRRGFKSNRKSGKAKEDGKVYEGIAKLKEEMDAAGTRTLGEHLYKLAARPGEVPETRIRNRYTLRAMYEEEFHLLWEKQRAYHPNLLNEDLARTLKENIIFFQRPLRLQPHLIGYCELEDEEKRCPRDRWEAQQFVLLQELNHLRRIDTATGEETALTPEERETLLDKLSFVKDWKVEDAYKRMAWPDNRRLNLEVSAKRTRLKGNAVGDALRKALGEKNARKLARARLVEIGAALSEEEDDAGLEGRMRNEWGLDASQAQKLIKAAGSMPDGYLRLSLKAIGNILPHLEAGCVFSEAKERAGYERRDQRAAENLANLPLPLDKRGQPLTANPVIQKALFEVRRLVNAVVREHGKPGEIVVELAREARGSIAERNDKNTEMRRRERQRREWAETIAKDFAEFKDGKPRRDDILKYELWLECGRVCPYTGRAISAGQLFSGEVQIEHILPYSRSLDDSFMNKSLCFADFNREKGNRTPHEFFSGTSNPKWAKRWEAIQNWVKNEKSVPWPKRRKFVQKEIETDKFIQRQLNDTRYLSRLVRDYLCRLCPEGKLPDQYVRCARGDLTAKLRWDWGLERVLDTERKNREDHRHHAVDALVVALTDAKRLNRLTANDERRRGMGLNIKERDSVPAPWADFFKDVKERVNRIVVSHKPTRKVSGALHEETFYGPTSKPGVYTVRKAVAALSKGEVEKIRDPEIRALVKSRCTLNAQGEVTEIPKDAFKTPLAMKSGVPVKKARIEIVSEKIVELHPKVFVKPGDNHHVAIYALLEEKKESYAACTVTLFDAAMRLARREPVVAPHHPDHPTSRLLYSLCRNDMLAIPDADGVARIWRVQQVWEERVQLRPHTYAGEAGEKEDRLFKSHTLLPKIGARKVTVDPLGRVYAAND